MNTQGTNSYIMLYLVFISVFISWLNAETIVKNSEGLLSGTQFVSKGERHFSTSVGIPFTEIPVGPLW